MLSRIESSAAAKNPADYYYFVDGVQVGELSNNGNHDLTRATYSETFVTRNWNFNQNLTSQPFRWNTTGGVTRGQFGGSGYDPISPTSQGMEGTDGRYQVREGDTLQGIAQQLFGDSSLWYMLADANGLSGAQSLAAGTSLIIPDKVTNIHNSARTFEVYDPNRALGDLSPTAAKPPKKAGKCGMFGQILLVVIAVAVTALTYGALTGPTTGLLGTILAGAASGAAGSIVSQGFGVATGIQDKFSWKGVAMAALSGAVGGGVGGVLKGPLAGSMFLGDAARGALSSTLTQGIGVAVGLQKKFDFAGVAAAGIGAGVAGAVARHLGKHGVGVKPQDINGNTPRNIGFYTNQSVSGMAGGIANAATRSLVNGTDFGDNLMAALPDVIGSTIGNMIVDAANDAGMDRRAKRLSQSENLPADIRGNPRVRDIIREGLGYGLSGRSIEAAFNNSHFVEFLASMATGAGSSLSVDAVGSAVAPAGQFEEPTVRNPLREMVERRIDEHNRNLEQRAERAMMQRNARTFAHYRGLRGEHARGLTANERRAILEAFPDLDISQAAIVNGAGGSTKAALALYVAGASAITLGDTVFANPNQFDNDWSDRAGQRALLVHEFTHVYQYTHYGQVTVEREIIAQAMRYGSEEAYNYYNRANHFNDELWEGQAKMVQHYTFVRQTGRLLDHSLSRAELERRLLGTGIYGL